MMRPLVFLAVLLVVLIGILLLKRASLEGKLILGFATLALVAFIRLYFYLLLFTALALYAFVGLALVWAWIAASRLKVEREVQEEAMAGESVPVRYRVRTVAFLPLYHVRVWDMAYREHADGAVVELPFEEPRYLSFLRLQANESSEASQHIVPPVRGKLRFGPIAIEGGDPFGMFTLIKWLPVPGECLVLPGWVRLSALPSIPARLGTREQEHLVSREGQSHEFLGTRAYSEGDSLRRVHWPLTARHDTLIVRQFQREVEEEMLVILDADRQADVGEGAENALEYLITLALSLVHGASDMGRPWMLVIIGDEIETISQNVKEPLLCAQYALARLEGTREEPVEAYLDEIRHELPGAACALLTARTDPGPALALAHGDAQAGFEAQSLLIRVDPNTFAVKMEEGIKILRRRREPPPPLPPSAPGVGAWPVPELTVVRGDDLSELFLNRALA